MMAVLCMEVILGSLTFTGSLMAAGKLQEILPQRPITYKGQNFVNLGAAGGGHRHRGVPGASTRSTRAFFPLMMVIPLLFGVLMIIPIGGADMPTVISLLNSYAGLSAAAMGFVLDSKLLIIAGRSGRRFGLHSLRDHVEGHEPLVHATCCLARSDKMQAAGAAGKEAQPVRSATAEEAAAILGRGEQGGHRSRLRHGRGAGATQSARTLRCSDASAAWT